MPLNVDNKVSNTVYLFSSIYISCEIVYSLMYSSLNFAFEGHCTMGAYIDSKLFHIALFKNRYLVFFFRILCNYVGIDMVLTKDALYNLFNLLDVIFHSKDNDIFVVVGLVI